MPGDYNPADLLESLRKEAAALALCPQQDIPDCGAHGSENMARILASQNLDAADRYSKGEVACYLDLVLGRHNHQCHLGFLRVPADRASHLPKRSKGKPHIRPLLVSDDGGDVTKSARDEGIVFLGVTELVEGPKGVIPSFVWIAPAKQRDDFRRQVLTDTAAVDVVIKSGQVISEREVSAFGVGLAAGESCGISGLIENGAQIIDGIEKDARQLIRHILCELDFVNVLARLRIFINEMGPWAVFNKTADDIIKVGDVVLCTCESEPWAVKQICHGQSRSDERP